MLASCEEIFGTRSRNRLDARETREIREKLEGKMHSAVAVRHGVARRSAERALFFASFRVFRGHYLDSQPKFCDRLGGRVEQASSLSYFGGGFAALGLCGARLAAQLKAQA